MWFAYRFSSLLPTDEQVSWQGHLFGFAGGIIGGRLFRDRRPDGKSGPGRSVAADPARSTPGGISRPEGDR